MFGILVLGRPLIGNVVIFTSCDKNMGLENQKKYIIKEVEVSNIKGKKLLTAVLFENQKPLPVLEIEPKVKVKYLGYLQIFHDLNYLKSCLIYLYENIDKRDINFLKKVVWQALIINYAKCFIKANGRKVKLESNTVFKNSNDGLLNIHKELMELRHQYVAHSGVSNYERLEVYLALDPTSENIIIGSYHSFKNVFTAGLENIKKYSILVEYVWQYVNKKIKEIDDNNIRNLNKTYAVEELLTNAYYVIDK